MLTSDADAKLPEILYWFVSLSAYEIQSVCFCGLATVPADFTSGGVRVFMVLLKLSESPWELRVHRAHLEKTLGKNETVP